MRKNEIIRKLLGITQMGYENCRDAHFQMWCNKYATLFALPLCKMAGDDHLINWYADEWKRRVELPFYMDNKNLIDAGIEDNDTYQDLFLAYPENINGHYPQTLFNDLRKRYVKQKTTLIK